MGDLWLIRHGETEWSVSGRHTGRTDIPLTARGVEQAKLLARRIAHKTFALVLTSPLARARETCHLAGQLDAARTDDDLLEWDYGTIEGRTTAEVRREWPDWTIWNGPVPGGETPDHVQARANRVIDRVTQCEGNVALFAHGHVLRILAASWLRLEARAGRYLSLDTASLSVLGHEHAERVIRNWNESYDLLEVR
jgi:probable phosphoglycerate mutase